MCGIIGAFDTEPDVHERITMGTRMLAHRGPDKQHTTAGEGFVFGHTLLSIMGLSPTVQPITSTDGRVTLTYNGEIYNYPELHADDPEIRARCSGDSDTEVLVEGLAIHGPQFLDRVNGIFAFAAFDHGTSTGYLARDRLGVKPLYYTTVSGVLYFSSELQALWAVMGSSNQPDPEAYYSYARFRYPLGERTFDTRARMLPPGSTLTVSDSTHSLSRYWEIQAPTPFRGSYEEALEQTGALVADAIRIQMRSDHSFCTYLSGGVDSSFLTAVAMASKGELDTYSIGLPETGFDESEFALEVADALNTRHHPYLLSLGEYREAHRSFVEHLGSPLGVPNQVAIWVLSRELARDHRVVLSGEGADEVFGGYGRIFLLPADWERLLEARGRSDSTMGPFLANFAAQYGTDDFPDYPSLFLARYSYVSHSQARELLAPLFPAADIDAARAVVEDEVHEAFRRFDTDPYTRQLLVFQQLHLPGLLLRLDSATMAHGVEARVPFLDHELLMFLNGLPIEYRMRRKGSYAGAYASGLLSDELSEVHDIPKVLLKELAERILSGRIAHRRKVGFPIPPHFFRPAAEPPGDGPPYRLWIQRNLELLSAEART